MQDACCAAARLLHGSPPARDDVPMLRRLILFCCSSSACPVWYSSRMHWRTEIDPVDPSVRSAFDSATITRGASLARWATA